MSDIESIALKMYQENMTYLSTKHIELYNKLQALELLLNDGRYLQKYDLEYINDSFDIKELSSGEYLYNGNSSTYSKGLSDAINFKKTDQVCESFYNFKFTQEAVQKAKDSGADSTFATIAPIVDYYDSHIKEKGKLKKVHKFAFFGLGLGLHIKDIIKKINPDIFLLIENDIEIFRLSLFTCNYKELFQNKDIYFSIAQNTDEAKLTLKLFYDNAMIRNQYLKFSLFSATYEDSIKNLQSYIIALPENCYSHERILYKNKIILNRIKEDFHFLNIEKKVNENYFDDKPVIIIGAGPSLHQNITWLKENHDQYIILSVFAALKTLYKNDISPDIVIQLDEKVTEGTDLINSFDSFDFMQNTVCIFNASLPDIYFETFPKENIVLVEDRSYYRQKRGDNIRATSVGEVAYSISLIFNAKETYLLGIDLALSEDGSSHAKDHHGANTIDSTDVDKLTKVMNIQKSTLQIKGNFQDKVVTTPIFAMSIPWLNAYTKNLKSSKQAVYNLSDGAYFEDTIPCPIKNIKTKDSLDKKNISVNTLEIFHKYSESKLSQEEINNIYLRQAQIKLYYSFIEEFEASATSTDEKFVYAYSVLINHFLNAEWIEARELIIVWFLNTSSYVTDFFNTQDISNTKKHTRKMKNIVASQLRRIVDYYANILEDMIEKKL